MTTNTLKTAFLLATLSATLVLGGGEVAGFAVLMTLALYAKSQRGEPRLQPVKAAV